MSYDKKLSGQHVQPRSGFRQTQANSGQPMSDDQLLFAARSYSTRKYQPHNLIVKYGPRQKVYHVTTVLHLACFTEPGLNFNQDEILPNFYCPQ